MLKSHDLDTISVDYNDMSVDYMNGFALGTMKGLSENSISIIIHIIIDKLPENELGVLIELYK
jgi:hypothetical protein